MVYKKEKSMQHKKLFLGVDSSLKNTGINIIDKNDNILLTTSIPTTNDLLKMYKEYPHLLDITKTQAYKQGLVDSSCKRTKKVKDYSKEEKNLLKVDIQKRMYVINTIFRSILENIINEYPEHKIIIGFEGISFGGIGRIDGLARLLGSLEAVCMMYHIKHILFPPTVVKRFAGKGNFDKDQMETAMSLDDLEILKKNCPKNTKDVYQGLDDRIDAYWISKLLNHTTKD